jgi:hypothetical protein
MPNLYDLDWPQNSPPIAIEMAMIKAGGYITYGNRKFGNGLFFHFKAMEALIWPEDYANRWTDWMLKILIEERIAVFGGSKDSGKTRRVSKWALMDYWAFPDTTLILMTSTTSRGLELRVYGDIKSLWERGTNRFPFLAGNPLDSRHGIFTDLLDDKSKVRDMRKGIIGIPTMTTDGAYDGSALIEFAGIKQVRRRLIGDEMQHISPDYLKVLFAMDDGEFKGSFLGNMIADNGKALDRVAEPENGWGSEGEIKKTTAWRNKYNGVTLNLVGIDSPNLDPDTLNRFPGMITQNSIDRAAKLPGAKDSLEWWSVIMGVRKAGAVSNRVLTVAEIERYGGFKECIWEGSARTRVYSIDAGFGGDACVRTWLEFGQEVHGQQVIQFGDQKVIPIMMSAGITAEKQIAQFAKADCDTLGIPYSSVFFDAGMFATLAVEMAREMSPDVNAVNFGGAATERPVGNDMMVFDQKTQMRIPKTWYQHVSKFVTELHFVVRLLAQCRQLRKFPREAAEEFGRREWRYVYGDRYELETKAEYKVRYSGESPNHADSLVIACEGARRLGFAIENMPDPNAPPKNGDDYLERELDLYRSEQKKRRLNYA